MPCQWFNCTTPTPESQKYCILHGKLMEEDKPAKSVYTIPKVSAKKKIADKHNKADKEALDKFFDDALMHAPFHCENCTTDLRESTIVNPRTIVCHILAKKKGIGGFPSVAAHPMNKFYGCMRCHKGYDEQGKDFILQMPLLETIKQRVQILLPLLTPEERNRVPEYLL